MCLKVSGISYKKYFQYRFVNSQQFGLGFKIKILWGLIITYIARATNIINTVLPKTNSVYNFLLSDSDSDFLNLAFPVVDFSIPLSKKTQPSRLNNEGSITTTVWYLLHGMWQ